MNFLIQLERVMPNTIMQSQSGQLPSRGHFVNHAKSLEKSDLHVDVILFIRFDQNDNLHDNLHYNFCGVLHLKNFKKS